MKKIILLTLSLMLFAGCTSSEQPPPVKNEQTFPASKQVEYPANSTTPVQKVMNCATVAGEFICEEE